MSKSFYKALFGLVITASIFITIPTKTFADNINHISHLFIVGQQKTIINYEKSQPSSIDNPVVDPNFNVMRSDDAESSTATFIVVG